MAKITELADRLFRSTSRWAKAAMISRALPKAEQRKNGFVSSREICDIVKELSSAKNLEQTPLIIPSTHSAFKRFTYVNGNDANEKLPYFETSKEGIRLNEDGKSILKPVADLAFRVIPEMELDFAYLYIAHRPLTQFFEFVKTVFLEGLIEGRDIAERVDMQTKKSVYLAQLGKTLEQAGLLTRVDKNISFGDYQVTFHPTDKGAATMQTYIQSFVLPVNNYATAIENSVDITKAITYLRKGQPSRIGVMTENSEFYKTIDNLVTWSKHSPLCRKNLIVSRVNGSYNGFDLFIVDFTHQRTSDFRNPIPSANFPSIAFATDANLAYHLIRRGGFDFLFHSYCTDSDNPEFETKFFNKVYKLLANRKNVKSISENRQLAQNTYGFGTY